MKSFYKLVNKTILEIFIKNKSDLLISKNTLNFWKKHIENIKLSVINPKIFYVNNNSFISSSFNDKYKILYLPSPKVKLDSVIDNFTGGLWTPRPSFYINKENNVEIAKILIKFVFNIFHGGPITDAEDLGLRIPKFFNYSNILGLKNDNFYPIAQHIVNSNLYYFEFSSQILKIITQDNVDYSSFKNQYVSSQTIIESIVINIVLKNEVKKNIKSMKIFAQNHKNPSKDHLKWMDLCYALLKQLNGDFRVHHEVVQNGKYSKKIIFYDAKLKTDPINNVSLIKGALCLTTNINKKLYNVKLAGDLKSATKNKIMSETEKSILKDYNYKMNDTIEDKNINIDEKHKKILEIINNIDKDINVKSLVFSRISVSPEDFLFTEFFINNMEDKINIEKIASQLDLTILFPKDGKTINILAWKKAINFIIETFPEDIKTIMLRNKERFDMLET